MWSIIQAAGWPIWFLLVASVIAVTTGGKIYIGQMKINDNGGSDLTVKVNIDVGSVNTTNFTDGNVVAIANDKFTVGGAAIYSACRWSC